MGYVAPVLPFFRLVDGMFPGFFMSASEIIKIFQLWTAIFVTVLLQPGSNKVVYGVIVNITLQHCGPVNAILLLIVRGFAVSLQNLRSKAALANFV